METIIRANQTPEEFNKAIWAFLTPIAMKRDWVFQRAYGKNVDPLSGFGSIAHSAAASLHSGNDVRLSVEYSKTDGGSTMQRLYVEEV